MEFGRHSHEQEARYIFEEYDNSSELCKRCIYNNTDICYEQGADCYEGVLKWLEARDGWKHEINAPGNY